MNFVEKPGNTAARASNGAERSRWRDEGCDPELVADPFDVAAAAWRQRQEQFNDVRPPENAAYDVSRTVGALVADHLVSTETPEQNPHTASVHLSFNMASADPAVRR